MYVGSDINIFSLEKSNVKYKTTEHCFDTKYEHTILPKRQFPQWYRILDGVPQKTKF